tara:strand:+ start:1224 stop:2246 length:1023 start_codon:yes stop_codon:yes gene_type:complete
MSNLNVLIAGATGYIGIQLVKLLLNHSKINIKYLCGNTSKGKSIKYFDKSIKSKNLPKITKFNNKNLKYVNVVFSALPNGEAQKLSKKLLPHNLLIDLSADFRLKTPEEYFKWYKIKHKSKSNIKKSIYSVPELSKKNIKNYKIISCPGCYPTSILLPLVPLLINKMISLKNIIIDSKSGYSGAGRGVHKKYANKNLYESLSAYGVGFHRHNSEIQQELNLYSKSNVRFNFTPHLTPMFRGILSTIYVDLKPSFNIKNIYKELYNFYKKDYFIRILPINTFLSTNDVINTNFCNISVCKTKYKNKLIIISAIDNLIKGGAGQAVQNLNYYYKFNNKKGLI